MRSKHHKAPKKHVDLTRQHRPKLLVACARLTNFFSSAKSNFDMKSGNLWRIWKQVNMKANL